MAESKSPNDEIQQLEQAIAVLESQRGVLGDQVVDVALAPMQEKLAALKREYVHGPVPAEGEQAAPAPGSTGVDEQSLDEQRKLVTVLFADLVGFTAMSEKLDAEDTREILNLYFSRWQALIEQHGGIVEKYVGDAVMAVFGIPVSHEADAENAVRTALAARAALDGLNNDLQRSWDVQLSMRVGVHTGPVVASFAGERKGQDFVVVGDTVNLASRLQSNAPTNAIMISHATYRLVRGVFDVQRLPPVTVKGKQEPVEVYLVLREKQRAFRAPTRGIEGIETRLVGREPELSQLKLALNDALEGGSPQILTIAGEAGIGKSRLMLEFDEWVELLPVVVRYYKGRAGPSMQSSPFSLLRDLFSFRFQIQDSDPPKVVQDKLAQGFSEPARNLPGASEEEIRARSLWVGELLGFQVPDAQILERRLNDPMQFRSQGLAYLRDYFKALAALRPVVLLLEDIHWADESSLEGVETLAGAMAGQRFLVVCTARPTLYERLPGWGSAQDKTGLPARHARLDLHPLTVEQSQSLVDQILQKADQVPAALRDLVVERAEGNPFFIEEFILMLIEEGVIQKGDEEWEIHMDRLAEVHTPSTLTEVLQSRLDALPPEEKMLLQRASVIGRNFWDEAVRFLSSQALKRPIPPEQADRAFTRLNAREMIYERSESAFEQTREFTFRHALLRDVAYTGMLKRLRKVYHAYAASWLESVTQRNQRIEEYSALIAEHYDLADEKEPAADWYQRAGKHAADHYSNAEALRFYNRAIEINPPEDLERLFDLLIARIKLHDLLANRLAQAEDLEILNHLLGRFSSSQAGDAEVDRRKALVLIQQAVYHEAMGDFQSLVRLSGEAAASAHAGGAQESEAFAKLYQGAGLWHMSDFDGANPILEQALALARAAGLQNMEADCLRNLGIVLQYLGKAAEAREHYESALEIYRQVGSLRGQSMTFNSLGTLHVESGDYRQAMAYFEESLRIKRLVGHLRAEHITLQNMGTLYARLWDFEKGIHVMERCLSFFAESGDRAGEYDVLGALSDILLRVGQVEQARGYLQKQRVFTLEYNDPMIELQSNEVSSLVELQTGSREAALAHLSRVLGLLEENPSPLDKVIAFNIRGQVLFGLGQPEAALEAYESSLALRDEIRPRDLIIAAQAGRAEALLSLGKRDLALESAASVFNALQASQAGELDFTPLEGNSDPLSILLHLWRVFDAMKDARAQAVLELAERLVEHIAGMMQDPHIRDSFLTQVPSVRAFRLAF